MKKKILSILLVIATLFTTACGQIGSIADESNTAESLPEEIVISSTGTEHEEYSDDIEIVSDNTDGAEIITEEGESVDNAGSDVIYRCI